ncbi:CRISPR-associated helicase/endonuclease Cas3 [Caldicellulosiruptor naganoensis]|uniref:CRISPR-associated helicase/endonuclease Cas3 n=1 Tax=Caldicellulosiruptor naganoensis TaxID=29324 RepID=A0ABY7BGL8_9FIRM|nr:CRISPR-associated helicase/endonuclease Cas3 [Caldicellulosiruptor naganoensis]WAM31477.1 CRISPR-associated helicase/endonuclease Cas3 [Caldicellulosiruptor naganoensis]
MRIYAKSRPEETLKEHTERLLHNLEILRQVYGEQIENIVPNKAKNVFWEMLKDVCIYHDCGKAYTPFQNVIRKSVGKEVLKTSFKNDIPHSYLSPAFVSKEVLEKYRDYKKAFIQAIAFHHERNVVLDATLYEYILQAIKEDLDEKRELVEKELSIKVENLNKRYYSYIAPSNMLSWWKDKDKEELLIYVILKGLLVRLDHCASAHIEIEDMKRQNLKEITTRYLLKSFNNLRELQKYVLDKGDKNLIIVASTGSGKTEAALIWAGDKKVFFTLPMRAALNAMFKRLKDNIEISNIGLLHSTSFHYIVSEEDDENLAFSIYQGSRYFSKQLLLTTIDQIFGFPFKYKGYEKILATLAYSKVIVDEIQGYSPSIGAVILKGLEMLNCFGTKFLIMTATLPQIYEDYLLQKGISFEKAVFFSPVVRHRIKIVEKDISSDVENIISHAQKGKVLIITNTISKALELFESLRERTEMKVGVIHSQFIQKHRQIKERMIKRFEERYDKGIWISTQIVEASLDIDFDFLFTELSTLDSLFQRMGRCFRKREYRSEEPNVFVYTENVSGIGRVYDREIHLSSFEMIKEFDGNVILEQQKMDLVKRLYSIDNIRDTKYYKEFKETLALLDSIIDGEFNKYEVHSNLRDIFNVKAIPIRYYRKKEKLFEMYTNEKNLIAKAKIYDKISKYIVEVPYYKVKNYISSCSYMKDIYILNLDYDCNTGIKYDRVISSELM